jgi:RNA polymerase sigma-70 factor (ECF subfamily)
MATGPRHETENLERFREYLRVLARLHLDRRIQQKVDPSDVVQETLIKAHEKIRDFRGADEAQLAAWLRTILARNMTDIVRHFRRGRRNMALEQSLQVAVDESSARIDAWLAAEQSSPSEQAMHEERLCRLASAIADLPEDQRTAIELHHLKGCSLVETSGQMEKTVAATAGLIRRGLIRLRDRLRTEE